jgi:FkbM family methyltransferase
LVNEIFVEGTYAVGPLGPGATILDCGANIGISTLYFALTYPEATIVAFEPDPSAYSLLSRNTDSLANVETCNVALGAEDGDLTFFVDPSTTASPMMSAIKERQPKGHSLTVPCVRLSTRIAGPVALLKIDVEGMEWAILDDLIDSGTIARVERMAIEYHHHLPADRDDLSSFLRMLEEHSFGYEISATRRSGSPSDRYQDVMIYAFKKD